MAWFTQKSYRRDSGDLTGGRLIDTLRFEAASDQTAIAEVSSSTHRFVPGTDFAVLLNVNEEIIWPVDNPNA